MKRKDTHLEQEQFNNMKRNVICELEALCYADDPGMLVLGHQWDYGIVDVES